MTAARKSAGRQSGSWRKLVKLLKDGWRSRNLPCIDCGQPIDYSLPWDHRDALTAEHIRPLSKYPQLAEDPTNLGPAHASCNKAKGDQEQPLDLGTTSREW